MINTGEWERRWHLWMDQVLDKDSFRHILQLLLFIFRSIMGWYSSQNNLCSPSKLASFLNRLMTWANLEVNFLCQIINILHHPIPTNPTERNDPYMQRSISWAFYIIMSRPTSKPYFWMTRYHCTKSFSIASPRKRFSPGLFSATLSLFFLQFISKVQRIIPYSQTYFNCDISPVWIFVMASSTSP